MSEGKDSFEVVKEFVMGLGERAATREEAQSIEPALRDIYTRLMRVRMVAPKVDLSERMWGLIELVGLEARPVREEKRRSGPAFGQAASFL
jgi:hypothetical protein